MSKIRILSEEIANKIAAGEVVERPSSVVKELLENSIDAGARRISIFLQSGGKRLIKIEDNGEGMDRDDLMLAFERHATSKITAVEDLNAISSLGFRGEALPSIASVSRLTIRSNTDSAQPGTELKISAGVIKRVSECAMSPGTTVEVRDLFFNIPARRKFLKSSQTELGHIMDRIIPYALAYPEVHFSCHHHSRELISTPPVENLKERIFQFYGRAVLEGLLELQDKQGYLGLRGFISKPGFHRSSPNMQFLFVNHRFVRNKMISHAIREAYHTLIPKGRYPIIFLFLKLPAEMVDVNVHPTKIEVRFQQQSFIHDTIRDSLLNLLQKEKPTAIFKGEEVHRERVPPKDEDYLARIRQRAEKSLGRALWQPGKMAAIETPGQKVPMPTPPPPPAQKRDEKIVVEGPVVVGQHKNSYILAADEEGLLIVDQHAAHERILFEQLMAKLGEKGIERQLLLMPLIIEIDPSHSILLEEYREELEKVGFVIDSFGRKSFAVKEIPAPLVGRNVEPVVREILTELKEEIKTCSKERIYEKMLITIACHSAIKANDPLSREEMQFILDELARTNLPLTCPHGRPIMLRIPDKDIQKNFLRS